MLPRWWVGRCPVLSVDIQMLTQENRYVGTYKTYTHTSRPNTEKNIRECVRLCHRGQNPMHQRSMLNRQTLALIGNYTILQFYSSDVQFAKKVQCGFVEASIYRQSNRQMAMPLSLWTLVSQTFRSDIPAKNPPKWMGCLAIMDITTQMCSCSSLCQV